MHRKVRYAELTPEEFRQRRAEAPIAYLPLGTLEWHGEHMPLGADGLQSAGLFDLLAQDVGGIVLPMLFLGPDRRQQTPQGDLYGMDTSPSTDPKAQYTPRQLDGSAYWVPEELFVGLLDAVMAQLKRAGFRIVVAHGHGPSTMRIQTHAPRWQQDLGLQVIQCWGELDKQGLGFMTDHAARNETSLTMALHPNLVDLTRLPADRAQWPLGVAGADPRDATEQEGWRIIAAQRERMERILRELLGK